MSDWTPAEIDRLRQMARAGLTIGGIAKTLGKSRNAVAGYMHRHGIKARTAQPEHLRHRPKSEEAKPGDPVPAPKPPKPQPAPKREISAAEARRLPPASAPYIFRECQFIAGDPRKDATKCGADTILGSSYCLSHHLRCWQAPAERKPRSDDYA